MRAAFLALALLALPAPAMACQTMPFPGTEEAEALRAVEGGASLLHFRVTKREILPLERGYGGDYGRLQIELIDALNVDEDVAPGPATLAIYGGAFGYTAPEAGPAEYVVLAGIGDGASRIWAVMTHPCRGTPLFRADSATGRQLMAAAK